MNKIYTLWKLKEGYEYSGFFQNGMLGRIFEEDYKFASLQIGGCGLDGTYVITRSDRKSPIIIFNTKSTTQSKPEANK